MSIISQSPSYLQRLVQGDYRSKEAPDPSFVIKIRRQEIVANERSHLISRQKIKSEKSNLWKSWKEDNDSSQLHTA